MHPRRPAVPAGADDPPADRRGDPDGRRGRHPGEEIFTDKYGRVKVQFPWDRQGKNDANSSCWVRVATLWAGKQWGMIHIPRVGQEVIVAFEEGDPDRPIIVGSVYNAENMPPYTLPDNKTQSGYQSRSTPQRDRPTNFNELRFEDKKDSEEIYFHAEKDFNRVVENNDTLKVGFDKKDKGDQTIEIFNNQIAQGRRRQACRRRQPDHRGLQQPDLKVGDGEPGQGGEPDHRGLQGPHRDGQDRQRDGHHRARQPHVTVKQGNDSTRSQGTDVIVTATTPTRSSRATATSRSTWATTR